MSAYFFDSSALVKRYITEKGTTWVRSVINPSLKNIIFIAEITPVEAVSAFARRTREGNLSQRSAKAARLLINRHALREYQMMSFSVSISQRAQSLLETYPLRGFDAIQLATALEINTKLLAGKRPSLIFVSGDVRLLNAATSEGLQTHQPI